MEAESTSGKKKQRGGVKDTLQTPKVWSDDDVYIKYSGIESEGNVIMFNANCSRVELCAQTPGKLRYTCRGYSLLKNIRNELEGTWAFPFCRLEEYGSKLSRFEV